MFNFDEEKLTDEQIMNIAIQDGLPPLRVAINANGYKGSPHFWCDADELFCIKLDRKQGVVVSVMHKLSGGKGVVNVRSLYTAVGNLQPFVGLDGVEFDLKERVIQWLEYAGAVCLVGDKVYLHPYLVSVDEVDIHKWCNSRPVGEHPSRLPYHLRYSEEEVEKAIEFYRKAKSLLSGE